MLLRRRILAVANKLIITQQRNLASCAVLNQDLNNKDGINDRASPQQIKQLDEHLPSVDEKDEVLAPISKRDCHIRAAENSGKGVLHRAFSVFLFNSKKELLLQQRSDSKVTFPNYFTNTCCSHPRYNVEELNENDHEGIRCAAQRRMNFELGIPLEQIPLDSFEVLTRVHYWATSDDTWAEHEIDYILICQRDVDLSNVNTDEVQFVSYKSKQDLKLFLDTTVPNERLLITPWFRYVINNFLYEWWDNLNDLSKFKNDIIHRAGEQS